MTCRLSEHFHYSETEVEWPEPSLHNITEHCGSLEATEWRILGELAAMILNIVAVGKGQGRLQHQEDGEIEVVERHMSSHWQQVQYQEAGGGLFET